MTREALKLALEALENYAWHEEACPQHPTYSEPENYPKCTCGYDQVITAIKEALAEHAMQEVQRLGQEIEQEPVAWWNDTGTHIDLNVSGRGAPLYTAPPQRTWVGLTDEERKDIELGIEVFGTSVEDILKEAEAKLKEKNCG